MLATSWPAEEADIAMWCWPQSWGSPNFDANVFDVFALIPPSSFRTQALAPTARCRIPSWHVRRRARGNIEQFLGLGFSHASARVRKECL